MKKKSITFLSIAAAVAALSVTANAAASGANNSGTLSVWQAFTASKAAIVGAVLFCAAVILFIIMGIRMKKKHSVPSSSQMINSFIVFFSISGILCMILGLLTDGATWSDMMHKALDATLPKTQFEDYFTGIRDVAFDNMELASEKYSPFSIILFVFAGQFTPVSYIVDHDSFQYLSMLNNQSCIMLYLFIVIFSIVAMYRMSRKSLRNNSIYIRDEIVAFLLVVSFPTIYCIELGNISGIALALVMFFVMYRQHEKQYVRELSLIALGIGSAIIPVCFVFSLFLFTDKKKDSIQRFIRSLVYWALVFFVPSIMLTKNCLAIYIKGLFALPEKFVTGNTSIANLLAYFGITNTYILAIAFVATEALAILCFFILPEKWQKATAAVYLIINTFSVSGSMLLIFIFIPFVMLIGTKKHKLSDWVYLILYTLLITPFPEWYYYDKKAFNKFLYTLNLNYIYSANELISLAVVQCLMILMMIQTVKVIVSGKKKNNSKPKAVGTEQKVA